MRVGWRIVAEIEYFCKITLLFNQVRPIHTLVRYKQSPLYLPLFKGRGVLHSHSKAYIKRALNNCKGETQHVPIKG